MQSYEMQIHMYMIVSTGFTYRLNRLKPRASKFRWAPVKVYNIFNTVIGLSHLYFITYCTY